MKKGLIILTALVMSLLVGGVYGYRTTDSQDTPAQFIEKLEVKRYAVKKNHQIIGQYEDKNAALVEAKRIPRSVVIDQETGSWIYSSLQPYMIMTKNTIHDFDNFASALRYAKKQDYQYIYFKDDKTLIWDTEGLKNKKYKLKVPHIKQLPELARGCEVTSLAMIFKYYDKDVSKLELAKKVKKDTTLYSVAKDGKIHYGNPYDGFVGNMYDIRQNGYGVYHGPIADLASIYFTDRVIDATGVEFEDLLQFIEKDIPVWIIINATYKPLAETEFEVWHTPTDIVKITNRMHSVVITGYDNQNVYVNDPLYYMANRTLNRDDFKSAWEQMGQQAVVIMP